MKLEILIRTVMLLWFSMISIISNSILMIWARKCPPEPGKFLVNEMSALAESFVTKPFFSKWFGLRQRRLADFEKSSWSRQIRSERVSECPWAQTTSELFNSNPGSVLRGFRSRKIVQSKKVCWIRKSASEQDVLLPVTESAQWTLVVIIFFRSF